MILNSGKIHRMQNVERDSRIRAVSVFFILISFIIIVRLFILMVIQHSFYAALAADSHEMYEKLVPRRGDIFIQDTRSKEEFPLAINKDVFLLYADTREIRSDDEANRVANELARIFNFDDEKKLNISLSLNKRSDPYEPLKQDIDQNLADQISSLGLPGLHFVRQDKRFYPEGKLAAHVAGFLGQDTEGTIAGRYGIEGYWQDTLSGRGGFSEGVRSAKGGWISLAGRLFKPAQDGSEFLLTIDRSIQYKTCEVLRESMKEYGAKSATAIVMDPYSGALIALCSLPDFDPNAYSAVENIEVYNNSAIFTPYEPGSIYKPIIMAAALNEEVVDQNTPFYDEGSRPGICQTPIRNAGRKSYQQTDMTGVLVNSINTGMVHIAEKLGKNRLVDYVEKFGFSVKTGIELDTEVNGNIDSLYIHSTDQLDCYAATASFGQGITVTPLQMTAAYAAIANGGRLLKPYLVQEIRHSDGTVERTRVQEIKQVLNNRAASLLSGMLVRTVDYGHAKAARIKGYYVAGKTGTAQIPGPGGYTEETNHSFVGFAPVDHPKFVMLVKFEKPKAEYAETTAVPAFGKIAAFILDYYQVPPGRD
ncbi:MAG: penicillin-binding protein 2 [Candidatus Magasanikbacteria bacterium]|nr:penicillin-binding protein 2 [Candidatus Magasanikbacteria bacterium]